MGDNAKIEWTDATWNPVSGCSKVSAGCKHCYAEREWPRLANNPKTPRYNGRAFTDVQCHPEILDQPLRWARPRKVFVNSMSDLFHEDVPFEFIDRVFAVMALSKHHTFQVLTKRPERMREYCKRLGRHHEVDPVSIVAKTLNTEEGFVYRLDKYKGWHLPNVWLGVTAENQEAADERIPILLQTPAAVRFVSVEPMVGPVMLDTYLGDLPEDEDGAPFPGRLDWIICGGESGPHARPMNPTWARSIRDQCASAGVSFLFKQWGEFTASCSHFAPGQQFPSSSRFVPVSGNSYAWDNFRAISHGDVWMHRVGKKAAGRLLDGVEYNGYPEARDNGPAQARPITETAD